MVRTAVGPVVAPSVSFMLRTGGRQSGPLPRMLEKNTLYFFTALRRLRRAFRCAG